MQAHASRAFWKLCDPLLVRIAHRLQHLKAHGRIRETRVYAEAMVSPTARIFPEATLTNFGLPAHLRIGGYSHVRGELVVVNSAGRLVLGENCYVGAGSRLWAQTSIEIGNYVLISHLVDVHDTNAHSLDWQHRRDDCRRLFREGMDVNWSPVACAAVRIEDDVWLGFKSSVLKGVTIGRGAVVAAGSVVTHDVAPYCVVAGNPARVIKELEPPEDHAGSAMENGPDEHDSDEHDPGEHDSGEHDSGGARTDLGRRVLGADSG